ncbi:MAG: hypothetical protein AMXMBFR83_06110 [Phycisphaerae bacterium]
MFFEDLVNGGGVPALEKMLAFTQARQRMLAENVANVDTPGYQAKQLDARAFQLALRQALDAQRSAGRPSAQAGLMPFAGAGSATTPRGDPGASASGGAGGGRADPPSFALKGTDEFRLDSAGRLVVTPSLEPADNVLFHDRTNARIERQMAQMSENAMMHQAVTELLRTRFENLLKAIRGRA